MTAEMNRVDVEERINFPLLTSFFALIRSISSHQSIRFEGNQRLRRLSKRKGSQWVKLKFFEGKVLSGTKYANTRTTI